VASLRIIPNLVTIRPADANETAQAWRVAVERQGPTALILSRQKLPTIDREIYADADGLLKGAYVLADMGDDSPELILMATGSEVSLILSAASRLAAEGVNVRVVSIPSWELFEAQTKEYQDQVQPPGIKNRLSVEAGVSFGWCRWVGDRGRIIGIDKFGASAPGELVMEKYDFTVSHIIEEALTMMKSNAMDNNGKGNDHK
jgi:transketolase